MMSDFQNTLIVTLAILVGSFFSYLLQFFLGRGLSIADYGTFNALLAITSVVSVPATVLGTSLLKKVSTLYATGDKGKISSLFWHSSVWSFALGTVVFGIFTFFDQKFFGYLQITDIRLIVSFVTYMSLTFLFAIPNYYFQGLLQYKVFSVISVFSSVLRLGFPLLVLFYKGDLADIFWGIVSASVISFFLSLYLLRKHINTFVAKGIETELFSILKFSLPVMAVNLCLISFTNNDLILVRTIFNPETVGYYAGAVTLGKILLFGSMPVATVMFPKIVAAKAAGADVKALFKKFFGMQFLIVFIGFLVFALFPRLIAVGFFGEKFLESVNFLPLYALSVVFYVLVNFLIMFLLAVDITDFYKLLLALAFSQVFLINRFNADLYSVIYVNLAVLVLGFLLLLAKALKYVSKPA